MQVITLYKYDRGDGKITVSPIKPTDKEYTEKYRLVADDGKVLTYNGEIVGEVIDTDAVEGWDEVDRPLDKTEEIQNGKP
jgi:hypothetical protein